MVEVLATEADLEARSKPELADCKAVRSRSGLRGGAPDAAYQSLVSRVGNEVRDSQRQQSAAETLRDAVQDRRDSTSGVSLDEEMTNPMRFQRAYQASARALSTLDEALDVLINRTGRVGL